jgi:hypothetical protein
MIRTWIVRYNPLVRRISTSSNLRPRAAICLTFGGLKQPLRWLQREETAVHIPRAAQLPPVPGLARADIGGRLHGDEISEFRLPRSLEPERMAPPPSRSRRHRLRALLMLLIASILAASTGYTFGRAIGAHPCSPHAGRKWPRSL